ncbi:polysaccharide pyruvyl transferase family protein [Microbacterium sp. MPKO10]|uniref:polysaccharide pyruvyl transferase family protein n=1 Tax=Microbacterium sp. MPKO10 TaxID=2989818 RepID=UPI002235B3E2|nr:polysaccharide pyruvyl transferase family protein [Microbacterium sp. MPKO10]MCW4457823.1 polysaccharide pyruvyl transferase family protein [Microbacterium sp. MPKO10]
MRILVRAGKAPHDVVSPEASFARNRSGVFGANVGNLLFTNAVYRAIYVPGSEVVVDSLETESVRVNDKYVDRINSEFDVFVLPLANAFRTQFLPWLDRLSAVIERLKIPVVVVGVGAQLGLSGDYSGVSDKTNASVARFMRAVLDHSASVGVRGEITADYLNSLGFGEEHVDVIGCPSMYDNGRQMTVEKKTVPPSKGARLGLNVTPSIPGMGKNLMAVAEQYPNSVYIPQEHRELALLLWGQKVAGKLAQGVPGDTSHPLYKQDRIRFFLDPQTWRDYLSTCEFAFGNRIHGNVAALTAGTPAVLLSHDSRTLELAQYHGIPYRPVPSAEEGIDVGHLYADADFTELNRVSSENFDRYTAFLGKNNISNIFDHGQANSDYERQLSSTSYPRPVGTLYADDREALISRVRWLWQGVEADQGRRVGAYTPPFAPRPSSSADELAALKAEVSRLEHKLNEHEGTLTYLRQPAEKRVIEGLRVRAGRFRRQHRKSR